MKLQNRKKFLSAILVLQEKILLESGLLDGEFTNLGDEIDTMVYERNRQFNFKMKARTKFFLIKIKKALEKIKNGTYGICEECGNDINEERLLARPVADYCIHCKEELEREEGHQLYEKKSHTNGKTFVNNNVIPVNFNNDDYKEKNNVTNLKSIRKGSEILH